MKISDISAFISKYANGMIALLTILFISGLYVMANPARWAYGAQTFWAIIGGLLLLFIPISIIAVPAIVLVKYGLPKAILAFFIFAAAFYLCLGVVPDITPDAASTQSDAYWRGEASPFAILEHSQYGNNLTMVIQNVGTEPIELVGVSLGGSVGSEKSAAFSKPDEPIFVFGDKMDLSLIANSECQIGEKYDYWVNFTYSENGETKKQVGAKTLVGKCS